MMVASLRRTLWIPTANQECGRSVWQRPVVGKVCTLDKAGFLSVLLVSWSDDDDRRVPAGTYVL